MDNLECIKCSIRRVGKAKRAHEFYPSREIVGTAQVRLCPPYDSELAERKSNLVPGRCEAGIDATLVLGQCRDLVAVGIIQLDLQRVQIGLLALAA